MRGSMLIFCSLFCPHTLWPLPGLPSSRLLNFHAWLPQAEQGNECKMPSWLKMRIIVVRWAPTAAPCHLTAHSRSESLVYLSLFLLTAHSYTSATFHTHTQGDLLSESSQNKPCFCSIDFVLFCNQSSRPSLHSYRRKCIIPACCIDPGTWNLASSPNLRASLIYI